MSTQYTRASYWHSIVNSWKWGIIVVSGPVYMEASFPTSHVSQQGEIISCQCLRVAGKLGQTGCNSGMLT